MAYPPGRVPLINAPAPLTILAGLLIALHALRVVLPERFSVLVLFTAGLIPERFWGWVNGTTLPGQSVPAYEGALPALAPLVLSALLHADWMHVLLNAAFLVAIGKPVMEQLRHLCGLRAVSLAMVFLLLFCLSQACGALVFLLVNYPSGPIAIGASGGLSGVLAAFLLLRAGRHARLLSRDFLSASGVFVAANLLLAIAAPSLLAVSIAWEVHLGGFLGGAMAGRVLAASAAPPAR